MKAWMNSLRGALTITVAMVAPAAAGWPGDVTTKCPIDSVKVGSFCMDKYEASVWEIPACDGSSHSNKGLITKVRKGTAKRADLVAANVVQRGLGSADYPCSANGQNCAANAGQLDFSCATPGPGAIFAVSLSATALDTTPIIPSAYVTWFQAQQACSNSGKRLPSNAEWQQAVAGTPDPGPDNGTTDCNTTSGAATATGARSSCVSTYGAFDMVGNVDEWVADWVALSTTCPGWGGFSNDQMCLSGASTTGQFPGALDRGGSFAGGPAAGPLAVDGSFQPSFPSGGIGFRCAR
jgi:formylglycine-generating enzyme required for sulfatase activity